MTSDTPIAQMASEAPESLSLAVIVEWWWNNSVVDPKMHGKEKISPLATKYTPVRLRSTLHFLSFKLHHRTIKTISPDRFTATLNRSRTIDKIIKLVQTNSPWTSPD